MNDNKDLFLELHPAQKTHLQFRINQLAGFLQSRPFGPIYREEILRAIRAAADCLITNQNYAGTLAEVDDCVSQEHRRCPQAATFNER